jgi:hypothetical protein
VKFRQQPKRHLMVLVPEAIDEAIRERAMRRSISEVATEIMCRGLDIDPSTFGIEPTKRHEPASAAS